MYTIYVLVFFASLNTPGGDHKTVAAYNNMAECAKVEAYARSKGENRFKCLAVDRAYGTKYVDSHKQWI